MSLPSGGWAMNELSLFTGAGGGIYASLLLGWNTIGYVEYDDYCQRVIAQRIKDGIFHEAPIFGDIRHFIESGAVDEYRGVADVVSGGPPCQAFSGAGKRGGRDDPRNLWPAALEVVRRVRPAFAFFENSPQLCNPERGYRHGYLGEIVQELAESGYDVRWRVLSAAEVGAPHKRDRLWIVAHANSGGRGEAGQRGGLDGVHGEGAHDRLAASQLRADVAHADSAGLAQRGVRRGVRAEAQQRGPRQDAFLGGEDVPHANGAGRQQQRRAEPVRTQQLAPERCSWWESESGICRVANGVADRVNRLRAIGNGQVPLVAATAWRLLTEGLDA